MNELKLVAHRGESALAPENTVAAFELAWQNPQLWAAETDIRVSRDGVLVCMHDADTLRTTGVPGKVEDLTLGELKNLSAGLWKGEGYRNCRIPELSEVLDAVPHHGHILVEIKKAGEHFAAAMAAALQKSAINEEQIIFISFNREELLRAKKAMPGNKAFLLIGLAADANGVVTPSAREIAEMLRSGSFDGADIGMEASKSKLCITKEYIEAIRCAGFEVHIWTVDDAAEAAELLKRGACSITTNCATKMNRMIETIFKTS